MTLEEFRKVAIKFSDHWFGYDPETQSLYEAHAATLIQLWDELPQTELFHYDLAVREAVMEKEMTWEEAMSPQGNLYRTLIAPGLIRHASMPDTFSRGEQGYGSRIRSFRDLCLLYNTEGGCPSYSDGMTNLVCTKGVHGCRIHATVNESCKNCPICFKVQNHVKAFFKQQGPFGQLPQQQQPRRQQQQPQQSGGNRGGNRGGQQGGSYASGSQNPRGGGGDGQARYSGNVRGRSSSREYRDDRRDRSRSPKPRNRPNKAARTSSGKKDDAARTDAS